jgi:hypothetical protein
MPASSAEASWLCSSRLASKSAISYSPPEIRDLALDSIEPDDLANVMGSLSRRYNVLRLRGAREIVDHLLHHLALADAGGFSWAANSVQLLSIESVSRMACPKGSWRRHGVSTAAQSWECTQLEKLGIVVVSHLSARPSCRGWSERASHRPNALVLFLAQLLGLRSPAFLGSDPYLVRLAS